MDLDLKNRRALVTGSTAGIGFAIAQELAAEGAAVIVNGRHEEGVSKAVARIKKASVEDIAATTNAVVREKQVKKRRSFDAGSQHVFLFKIQLIPVLHLLQDKTNF